MIYEGENYIFTKKINFYYWNNNLKSIPLSVYEKDWSAFSAFKKITLY